MKINLSMKKENPIKNLVKEITEKRIIDNDKINNYIEKSNLVKTKFDKMLFLKEYAKIIPYPGLYVGKEFLKCSTLTKKYANFLVWLVKKNFYILDRSELVGAYKDNPELVEYLYNELSKNTDESVAYVLGSLLGGMGIKEPQKLFDLFLKNNDLVKPEPVIISAIQETSYFHEIPKKFIDILMKYSHSEDRSIKNNAIRVLLNRFNKNEKVCRKLISLVKTDEDTKSMIAQLTGGISKENPALCLQLLQQCATTNEQQMALGMAMYVGYISRDYPIECLSILKNWLKKFDLVMPGQHMMWAAEQIGETKCFEKIEEFLLEWINIEARHHTKNTYRVLEFSLPRLTYEIYKKDESHLLSLLEKIDYRKKRKSSFIVRTIETIFSEAYDRKSISFNDSCRNLLEKIAIHLNIDTSIDQDIENPMMQTLALVQNIRLHKKQIDPVQTKRNLKQFPNIIDFFGRKKLHELIDTEKNHSLVLFLSKSKVTKQFMKRIAKKIDRTDDESYKRRLMQVLLGRFHSQVILDDLDKSLEGLDTKGTKELRGQILHEGFYPGLIQLNIYARLKKKYHVELEPKVPPKTLDIKLIIDNKNYFFEIYTPKNPKRLDYVRTAHAIDRDKTLDKVIEKFLEQLKACKNLNSPVILIIDNQNMSMDEYDIRNFLEGSLQFRIPLDSSIKKQKPYAIRANDSFNEKFEEGNLLNAIILLRRVVDDRDLKVKLYGQTYENPGAKFPIDEKIFKKIEDSLFNTGI